MPCFGHALPWSCFALVVLCFGHALLWSCFALIMIWKTNSEEKVGHDFITIWSLLALALIMPWPCFDHALGSLCVVSRALFA